MAIEWEAEISKQYLLFVFLNALSEWSVFKKKNYILFTTLNQLFRVFCTHTKFRRKKMSGGFVLLEKFIFLHHN